MSTKWFVCTLAVVCLWLPHAATAQTTGAIAGAVYDQNGNVVEGATVKVSGALLAAGRTITTAATGQYTFTLLLPGTYTVEASKQSLGASKRDVVVEVDRTATVDIVLGLNVQQTVEVSAAAPVVDLKSTEVAVNFKAETLAALPLERTYRGLFQLIPGVADNRSTIGPAAGGTRQDNTYLIDGANITNPGFGNLGMEVNELDIAEVNLKRAGVSAEFGRSAGAVTNAVSKSGTNRITGTARVDWLADPLISDFTNIAFRDTMAIPAVSPAIGVGGPFLKDKLFWYGSARYFKDTISDRINKLGDALPDRERSGHELYGKVTAQPSTKHLINVSFRDRPNTVKNSGLGSGTTASVATNDDNSSRVATASWGYFIGPRTVLDVRYLYMKENNEGVPITNLGFVPDPAALPAFDPTNLAAMGYVQDQTRQNVYIGGAEYTNTQNYRRHEIRGTFTRFLDLGNTNHEIKAGAGFEFGEEILSRLSNGWGAVQLIGSVPNQRYRLRYYFAQPPQLGQGRTWSVFVQDNVTIASRLTVNAGLLLDRDDFAQNLTGSGGCPTPSAQTLIGGTSVFESKGDRCTFVRFGFTDEIQPRLGANYNVRKDKGDKIYANWGRYYNMDQKSSGRSLAPRRIFQREALFTTAGVLISDGPRASTTGKLIDPDLKPIYNDEVLVGYATPLMGGWSLDTFFMYRKTNNFMEDVPTVLPDSSPYAVSNLPCTRFAACQPADAKRSYKAFTFEVARRLANKWSANISYTWSRFEGNFDLDYSTDTVFNTSSFIQDGPGTNVEEPNRFGPLRQDRPHVFKVFGSWLPMDPLTVGAYLRVQSGTPWNARGQDWEGTAALRYLEPAGSHRNPTWTNLDLLGSYRIRVNGRSALTLEARLLNVFGNQTRISTDSIQFLDTPKINTPPYFADSKVPNAFFGTANGYAPPRRVTLAALFTF